MKLNCEERERYSRHLLLPDIGFAGQKKLKSARILCVGTGGLGSPVLQYLAAAGVGHLGIIDFDVVDAANLHRQIIHRTSSVGKAKVESAAAAIKEINPNVKTELFPAPFTSANALALVNDYDLIIDCTDNFPTRYLVNDACEIAGKAYIYGSIFRFEGQASVFNYQQGPTYRDLYPEPPDPGLVPNCAVAGVLGILPGIIGLIQATEAIKLILGKGESLSGRLLLYDALKMRFRELKLKKNPARKPIIKFIDYDAFCGIKARQSAAETIDARFELTARQLAEKLKNSDLQLLDVREMGEWEIGHLQNALLIPLRELADRLDELDKKREIVVYCRTGIRSIEALTVLHAADFSNAKHLHGGLHAWSDEIDPNMPKY